MWSSFQRRAQKSYARSIQTLIGRSAKGTNGTTSVAPIRGCSPRWWRRSIRSVATVAPAIATSTASDGSATKVTTIRLWEASAWTSITRAPRSPLASASAGGGVEGGGGGDGELRVAHGLDRRARAVGGEVGQRAEHGHGARLRQPPDLRRRGELEVVGAACPQLDGNVRSLARGQLRRVDANLVAKRLGPPEHGAGFRRRERGRLAPRVAENRPRFQGGKHFVHDREPVGAGVDTRGNGVRAEAR